MYKCSMNCFECEYEDCVNNSPATEQERKSIMKTDKSIKKEVTVGIDMTRYIYNRPDKKEYERARNREYEQKRGYTPKRKEQKHNQYLRHKEAKLAYQNKYYAEHKEEILARQKAYYEAHKEEINSRRKKQRKAGVKHVS